MLRTLAVTLLLAASACSANTGNWYAPPKVVKPALVTTQPAVAVAVAAPAPTLTPYEAFAWHPPTQPLPHVVAPVPFSLTSSPADIARQLKQRPAGQRVLLNVDPDNSKSGGPLVWDNPADLLNDQRGPWITNGAAAEAAKLAPFYAALKADGAQVDYLILDSEPNLNGWVMTAPQLAAIKADPRWSALQASYGLNNLPLGTLYGDMASLNLALQVTLGGYLHAAFDAPLVASFPAAHCSDYNDVLLSATTAPQAPDFNGCIQPAGAPLHGDIQAPSFYGSVGNVRNAGVSSPITVLCWEVSAARAYAQAVAPVVPWLAGKTWTNPGGYPVPIANSPWWDELVFHLLLSTGSTNLNLWDSDTAHTQDDCSATEADLAALSAAAGGSATLAPVSLAAVPYSSTTIVSGAKLASGKTLWRVTVATTQPTNHQVSVTFLGDAGATKVSVPAGECGAWITR